LRFLFLEGVPTSEAGLRAFRHQDPSENRFEKTEGCYIFDCARGRRVGMVTASHYSAGGAHDRELNKTFVSGILRGLNRPEKKQERTGFAAVAATFYSSMDQPMAADLQACRKTPRVVRLRCGRKTSLPQKKKKQKKKKKKKTPSELLTGFSTPQTSPPADGFESARWDRGTSFLCKPPLHSGARNAPETGAAGKYRVQAVIPTVPGHRATLTASDR